VNVSLVPMALLVLGGWLVWWGLRRRRGQVRLPDGWLRIDGTVIDVGDGAAVPPRIEYRSPDGRRLRVPGPMATPFTVGQAIAVLVDPSDPTRARLDLTDQEAARLVVLLVTVGIVLLLLGAVSAAALL
jgi:hypothetical protein